MLDDRSQMWRPGACMHCVCVVCAMASGAELKGREEAGCVVIGTKLSKIIEAVSCLEDRPHAK
eukprot:scaffold43766_cov22-Tisochrysis_lutea.AAC.1